MRQNEQINNTSVEAPFVKESITQRLNQKAEFITC